jgi:hypothetical protein
MSELVSKISTQIKKNPFADKVAKRNERAFRCALMTPIALLAIARLFQGSKLPAEVHAPLWYGWLARRTLKCVELSPLLVSIYHRDKLLLCPGEDDDNWHAIAGKHIDKNLISLALVIGLGSLTALTAADFTPYDLGSLKTPLCTGALSGLGVATFVNTARAFFRTEDNNGNAKTAATMSLEIGLALLQTGFFMSSLLEAPSIRGPFSCLQRHLIPVAANCGLLDRGFGVMRSSFAASSAGFGLYFGL